MDQTHLYAVAVAAKVAVVDYYAARGVTLPARRLVTPGLPAWDCELLAVQAESLIPFDGDVLLGTSSSREAAPAFQMRAVNLGITVARCTPLSDDGEAPAAQLEEATAKIVLTDAGLCWNALVAAQAAERIPCCGSLGFLSWTALGPEGGLVGGLLRVAVSLE